MGSSIALIFQNIFMSVIIIRFEALEKLKSQFDMLKFIDMSHTWKMKPFEKVSHLQAKTLLMLSHGHKQLS